MSVHFNFYIYFSTGGPHHLWSVGIRQTPPWNGEH